jgi:hypothetical protein
MELSQKADILKTRTISREAIDKFAKITDCAFQDVVEMIQYWRDKGDFDGVKEYIISRNTHSMTERIRKETREKKDGQ